MVAAGIDAGARTVGVVLLRDGEVVGRAVRPSGHDAPEVAAALLVDVLAEAGLGRGDVDRVVATGSWRERVMCHGRVSEAAAAARGAVQLLSGVRTVVEVGAEEARSVRLDDQGAVVGSVTSEACAAGAGLFAETLARLLGVPYEALGALCLESTGAVAMSAQCMVFAEREAADLLREGTPRADIALAVHEGIAGRVASMVRRLGYRSPVMLVGGLARNDGFVRALCADLQLEALHVPGSPEHCGALGAALLAAEPGRWA